MAQYKKIKYWTMFWGACLTSFLFLLKITSTDPLLLLLFSSIAISGYYCQERLNDFIARCFKKFILKIFLINAIEPPPLLEKFRKYVFSIAITCLFSGIGIDLTTGFVSGSNFESIKSIPLNDLSLFLVFIGLIPEIIWTFNYGVNKNL